MKKKKPFETKAFQKKLKAILLTIGNNLYTLRNDRKESLQTVAKAVGISRQFLSRIEKGLAPRFRLTVLGELCRYYNVQMTEVVTKASKPKVSKANFSATKTTTWKLKKPVKN